MGRNCRKFLQALGFGLWLTVATYAATALTAWHAVSLPSQAGVGVAVNSHAGTWHLTHYLSADCACSRAVARHLMARGPLTSAVVTQVATEDVVFVSSTDAAGASALTKDLSRRGFAATMIDSEIAASLDGVEGVPALSIQAPDGTVRFRGGYRDRGAPPGQFLDVAILSGLMASKSVPHPRVYGCATSRRLLSLLDPFSLRRVLVSGKL